jgi:hypothetical protein
MQKNKTYWRRYRLENPDYACRNRSLQKMRNAIRISRSDTDREMQSGVAKRNESTAYIVLGTGFFKVPVHIDDIAKIDSILVRIDVISRRKRGSRFGGRVCKESTL